MATIPPLVMRWDGEAMRPLSPELAARHYAAGETYRMAPYEARSTESHNHYFAAVAEGWNNLSDHQRSRWPSPEHLRKWALIQSGYADQRSTACQSAAEAERIAAFVRPMDEYAVVVVRDAIVFVYTAQSQSYRAMGKARFQESKDAVLDTIAHLIGTERATLEANAGAAA